MSHAIPVGPQNNSHLNARPTVADLVSAIEAFAPASLAEPWDNVGLLLGSRRDVLTGPVLLTIDLTEGVLEEALGMRCSAIICYHPPIFAPIKKVTDEGRNGSVLLRAARAGLAIYAPHTALDATTGGMTDWLADCLLTSKETGTPHTADRRALRPAAVLGATEQLKLVTFVPREAVERVRLGLASAGAGKIGAYSVCSFAVEGTGTFFGDETSKPVVGQAGQLETATEVRLEMVCSRTSLAIALQTLRQFHPYEQPAIDVYELQAQPRREIGLGRRLILDQPQSIETLAARLKANLGVSVVSIARAHHEPIKVIGVCPGSGGELAPLALAEGCQLFVTGEMKHHDVLANVTAGLSIALGGHTNTERGYLPHLAKELAKRLPTAAFAVSAADADPQRPA